MSNGFIVPLILGNDNYLLGAVASSVCVRGHNNAKTRLYQNIWSCTVIEHICYNLGCGVSNSQV